MSLSLCQRPACVAFLDDDDAYLEMLAMVIPASWQMECFARSTVFLERLREEPELWETDTCKQQQIVDRWRQGQPLVPQILRYWAEEPQRLALCSVAAVDYSMPGMDGLQVLAQLPNWVGSRVLLTGQADEQVAVSAFNRSLIDLYLPKQTPNMARALMAAIEAMLGRPNPRHQQIWRSTLTSEQNALLLRDGVAAQLDAVLRAQWVEYIFIGQPFGVIGQDRDGNLGWLQLETTSGLADLAELARAQNAPASLVRAIENGEQLVDLEVAQCLGYGDTFRTTPTRTFGSNGKLIGGLFSIAPVHTHNTPYAQVLQVRSARHIQA